MELSLYRSSNSGNYYQSDLRKCFLAGHYSGRQPRESKSKCPIWCRLWEIGSHLFFFNCTHTWPQTLSIESIEHEFSMIYRCLRHAVDARPTLSRYDVLVVAGPVAQRLEQRTHNPLVLGSNPSGPTNKFLSPEFGISWFSSFAHFPQIREHSRTKLPRPAPQPGVASPG